jgi:hypothetical protein
LASGTDDVYRYVGGCNKNKMTVRQVERLFWNKSP